jgi:IS1 family transposase
LGYEYQYNQIIMKPERFLRVLLASRMQTKFHRIIQELPKLRINLGIGDGLAVVTTIDQERGRNPNRQTRRKNISNNNHKLKSNSKSKQKRRSKKDSSDESSAVELSSSDDSE